MNSTARSSGQGVAQGRVSKMEVLMAVISYRTRWGHDRTRTLKGHPRRKARRNRARVRRIAEINAKYGISTRPKQIEAEYRQLTSS